MNNMKPGRELDALIAEKVFGLGRHPIPEGCAQIEYEKIRRKNRIEIDICLHYSTDMSAAWEVVENLLPNDDEFRLGKFGESEWKCTFTLFEGLPVRAATAPHAICLAALEYVAKVK